MQRFKLLQQFEVSQSVQTEPEKWPKGLFLAQFDRFELWAVNLGVFVMGHGSLDYRIRDSESMREAILKMLQNLTRSLEEVLDYLNGDIESEDEGSDIESEMESDMDLLLDSVKDPIDRLYKMTVWIRNPATRLPSSKARNFQQIDQETKVDLFRSYEAFDYDYISSLFLQYEKEKALQESPTARHEEEAGGVDDQDQVWEPIRTTLELNRLRFSNGTESYLIRRIARANGRRRQQFAYWGSHKDKLRAHSSVVVDAPTHDVPDDGPGVEGGNKDSPAKAPLTVTTATQLRLSNGAGKEWFEKANVLDFAVSEYAPSAWEPSKDVVSFPLPPKVSAEDEFFECPYCYTICPASILAKRAWRAHVIRDLRPYVCTYERCSTAEQLYDNRDDWIQHETSAHHTILRCPKHEGETFTTKEAYETHIHEHHHGETLPLSLAQSTLDIHRGCPICSIGLQTTQKLQSHVALHLERFAMFTLPRSVEGAEGSDCESRSTGVNLASDRSSNGCSHTNSDSDGRDQDVNMSMQALMNDMRDLQNQLEESRSSTLQRPEQDATDFLRELAGIQMQVKRYEKIFNTCTWSIREKGALLEQLSELCIAAGMIKEAIGVLEQLQSLQLDLHLPSMQQSIQKKLESAHQVIQMVNEVDELFKDGSDIHTEPGRTRALDIFARSRSGMRHAETLSHILRTLVEDMLIKHREKVRLHQEEVRLHQEDVRSHQEEVRLHQEEVRLHQEEIKTVSELTNKMRSFDGKAVETRLEEVRVDRKQRQLSREEHQASSHRLEWKSNQMVEQGQIGDLLSISPEGMAELPRSDTMIINRESGDSSSAENDQSPPPPWRSGKDGERQTTTPVQESGEPDTGRESDPTTSPGAGDAQEGLVHEDRVSWRPNRDESPQPDISADFGKFSDWLSAEGERVSLTTTDNPDKQDTQADQQIQEDSEMEEEREQVEREMQVFRHIYHPLWVAAQLERQLEAKATDTQDKEGKLIAHQLEMDLRIYRDDVGKLESQFLTEARKQERSEKAQVLTTKIQSFHWKAVEKRLEEIRVGRRVRLEATRGLSTRLDEATEEVEEARQDEEAQEDGTQRADPEDGLAREPRQIRIVERGGERKRALSASPSRRPRPVGNRRQEAYQGSTSRRLALQSTVYWRCCKCAGGWLSYQLNYYCPMCQEWRCPGCEYSMS
ncbi:hypothetical protein HDV57DRAFT_510564 [Trichoderma longibrachiatum]